MSSRRIVATCAAMALVIGLAVGTRIGLSPTRHAIIGVNEREDFPGHWSARRTRRAGELLPATGALRGSGAA